MNLLSDTSLNPNLATRCRILKNGLHHPEQWATLMPKNGTDEAKL